MAAYLREAFSPGTVIRMSPGDPSSGQRVFRQKQCASCHAVRGTESGVGPDFAKVDFNKSVAEIAASMWNHGPEMMELMQEEEIGWPLFQGTEMADLIAYLYFLGFEDEPGDPDAGAEVLIDKGCDTCHELGGEGAGPDLTALKRFGSPIRMMQLMWNHAPKMEDMLLVQNEDWPKLTKKEMQDLYAFLKKATNPN
jgi:cytochrome c2